MRDILKLLNDRSPGDLSELKDGELRRFEVLCENWRTLAEAELARCKTLPRGRAPQVCVCRLAALTWKMDSANRPVPIPIVRA